MHAAIAAEDDGGIGHISGLERIPAKDARAGKAESLKDTVVLVRMENRGNTHRWIVGEPSLDEKGKVMDRGVAG